MNLGIWSCSWVALNNEFQILNSKLASAFKSFNRFASFKPFKTFPESDARREPTGSEKNDLNDLNLLNGLNVLAYDSNFRIAGMRQATRDVRTMTMAPIIATVVGAPRKCAEVPANSAPSGMKPRSSM